MESIRYRFIGKSYSCRRLAWWEKNFVFLKR